MTPPGHATWPDESCAVPEEVRLPGKGVTDDLEDLSTILDRVNELHARQTEKFVVTVVERVLEGWAEQLGELEARVLHLEAVLPLQSRSGITPAARGVDSDMERVLSGSSKFVMAPGHKLGVALHPVVNPRAELVAVTIERKDLDTGDVQTMRVPGWMVEDVRDLLTKILDEHPTRSRPRSGNDGSRR